MHLSGEGAGWSPETEFGQGVARRAWLTVSSLEIFIFYPPLLYAPLYNDREAKVVLIQVPSICPMDPQPIPGKKKVVDGQE